MSSRMTKDQLRDALADVGVKTAAKMKKAELVKLYREKILDQQVSTVSPNDSLIGGFSSDEEEPMSLDTSHITRGSNVKQLSNDEIFFKLKELGEHVGPILDSTRSIYERKLVRLLGGDEADGDYLEKSFSSFSADEEEEPDKDETDEYDVVGATGANNEHYKSSSFSEKLLDDGGFLKMSSTIHNKLEQNDGNVVRTRRSHMMKTYANEAHSPSNGKSFIPPPPKKRSVPIYAGAVLLVLVVFAVLVWLNLEPGNQIVTVPSTGDAPEAARVPASSGIPIGATGRSPK